MLKYLSLPLAVLMLGSLLSPAVFSQDAERGETLYKENNCLQCHGAQGQGVEDQNGPRIGGQFDWYLLTSLKAFKSQERQNPEMYPFIENLSDQDFKDLAAYVSSLSGRKE